MNLPKDVTVMSSDWTKAATSILLAVSSVIAANHHKKTATFAKSAHL